VTAASAAALPSPSPTAAAPAEPDAAGAPPRRLKAGGTAIRGERGMVASEDPIATRVGATVLEQGGNAVDAAVAVGFALAVTHQSAGTLGGGGFMIVHLASGETHAVDFREIAPAAATVALNEKQLGKGARGWLSAPVPGVTAGLALARERFGTRPLAELVAPALALARDGHPYGPRQALVLGWYWDTLKKDPVLRAIFGRGPGKEKPITAGQVLKQPALAATLRAIAEQGPDGFYRGEVAARIARAMKARGGLVAEEDLGVYQAKLRVPLGIDYHGFRVLTMPPPSMGGIALVSMLRTLDRAEPRAAKPGSALALHWFIEASRRAYADRRAVAADPDVVPADLLGPRLERLLDPRYHAERQPPIDPAHATPSSAVVPLVAQAATAESPDTTHYSVIDRDGNAVSCTTTLSAAFGSGVIAAETGVLFSNAMGAFSPDGVNVLVPRKRMASSMTPVILLQEGKVAFAIGSPGGDTIPGTVTQIVRNVVDYGLTVDEAIEAPRVHHQWLPDAVRIEKDRPPPPAVLAELRKLGHKVDKGLSLGDANGVLLDLDTGIAWGWADTRKGGLAAGPGAAGGPVVAGTADEP
jgi:gamma-glutamyltranspeptidase/glutathione hydrolase